MVPVIRNREYCMKIVFTVAGKGLEAPMDPRFGRCAAFLIYDLDTDTFAVEDNPHGQAAQGAGIQAAETVVRLGGQALVSGHCGPKAFQALRAAGVTMYTTTAAEARAEAAARLTTGKTRLNGPRAEARPPSGHGAFAHRSCSISSWHVSSSSVVYGVCPDRTTFSRPDRSHWLRPDHPSGLARVHRSCPRFFAKAVRLRLFFVAAPHR